MNHKPFIKILAIVAVFYASFTSAADKTDDERLAASVDELKSAVGAWSVVTQFLNTDGTVAREATGEYVFDWVVKDRVLSGHSSLPDLDQKSALLFYINEKKMTIEMVSVAADGYLWIMKGPVGAAMRYSQEFQSSDGKTSQLRFEHFNFSGDRFESRMEYTSDGGKTWTPGNHQVFTRQKSDH